MNIHVGAIIETNWNTGPYRVTEMIFCDADDCFIYHHRDCKHDSHYHLVLLDSDHKGISGISDVRLDGTCVMDDSDFVSVLPESSFPPHPKKLVVQQLPQMELFA